MIQTTHNDREWYREDISKIIKHFNSSDTNGLTHNNYQKNLDNYGKNVFAESKTRNYGQIFLAQFSSPLVYILIVASLIMFFLGDYVDAGIIFFIVILNAIVGSIQEGKAENTLLALKKMVKSYAIVIRDGKRQTVDDSELVPGDIILLKDGSQIPADARLIESNSLKVNQSTLTGESEMVLKHNDPIGGINIPVADRYNMVFRGTWVVSGLAKAIVVRTGYDTIVGQISKKLSNVKVDVPLKKNIQNISNIILMIVIFISIFLFFYGIATGKGAFEMFLTVVAISVSAIPEGLPLIVTLILATGVWRMSQRNVLVKKMQAVEALGQANVIALDKTGTITKNQMTVGEIFVGGRYIEVTGDGYSPRGHFVEKGNKIENPQQDEDLNLVMKACVLTSVAQIDFDKNTREYLLKSGDPTEASLIVMGQKFGFSKEEFQSYYPKIMEFPFDFKTKHHSTINKVDDKEILFSAGSPEVLLDSSTHFWQNGKKHKIDQEGLKRLDLVFNTLSEKGYRILGLAFKENPPKHQNAELKEMVFIGYVGIIDAIRTEVLESVKKVRDAQMKVVMITGDHVKTAESIAKKVGIFQTGDLILSGTEINQLNEKSLIEKLDKVTVFARVTPEHKMKIIDLYRKKGDVVAMTGDGVNDAIALTSADLGVSMGQGGTEVAREASDIVLLDDNFASIVSAAEEGRNIYWTIRKNILFLLSTNLAELLVIAIAILFKMPLPLLATQIIWLNLVTDTLLATTLAVDPKEKNIMSNLYRRQNKNFFDRLMIIRISLISLIMTIVTLWVFNSYLSMDVAMERVWTISLTTLAVFQWYNIFNVRSHFRSIFNKDLFSNKWLLLGLFLAIGLHIFAVYNPFMQGVLKLAPLLLSEWLFVLSIGLILIFAEEIRKLFYRRFMCPNC